MHGLDTAFTSLSSRRRSVTRIGRACGITCRPRRVTRSAANLDMRGDQDTGIGTPRLSRDYGPFMRRLGPERQHRHRATDR